MNLQRPRWTNLWPSWVRAIVTCGTQSFWSPMRKHVPCRKQVGVTPFVCSCPVLKSNPWLRELLYLWLYEGKSFDESKFLYGSLATTFRKLENVLKFPPVWLNIQSFVFHLYGQVLYPFLGLTKVWVYTNTSLWPFAWHLVGSQCIFIEWMSEVRSLDRG